MYVFLALTYSFRIPRLYCTINTEYAQENWELNLIVITILLLGSHAGYVSEIQTK